MATAGGYNLASINAENVGDELDWPDLGLGVLLLRADLGAYGAEADAAS